eukprot:3149781-Alexandrium_andersonii.AAC.1
MLRFSVCDGFLRSTVLMHIERWAYFLSRIRPREIGDRTASAYSPASLPSSFRDTPRGSDCDHWIAT